MGPREGLATRRLPAAGGPRPEGVCPALGGGRSVGVPAKFRELARSRRHALTYRGYVVSRVRTFEFECELKMDSRHGLSSSGSDRRSILDISFHI